jgi:hypothetical protein
MQRYRIYAGSGCIILAPLMQARVEVVQGALDDRVRTLLL